MQNIDYTELEFNKFRLVEWQQHQWNRDAVGLRLHVGSGHLHLSKYCNIDPYTEESDCKDDMRYLPSFEPNSAIEIVSEHSLEHIPIHQVYSTLKRWYEILVPNGTLEVGIPDVELLCQSFLEMSEENRWKWGIFTLYGAQTNPDDIGGNGLNLYDEFQIDEGQFHKGGFSLGIFIRMLETIGFKITNGFWYNGFNTPSFFVYAYKPEPLKSLGTIIEQDCAIGTFSNKITYIKNLWKSCQKFIPHVQFITRINRGPINMGMELLRQDFIKSGKRFWIFMDDDIQILNSDIIKNALETLINEKYGIVGVYSTFNPNSITEPYNIKELTTRIYNGFIPGYFMLVDSEKVGDVLPDLSLPDPNTSIDTSYCSSIRAKGYDLGISADYVYHVDKGVTANTSVIDITNKYLMNKWGKFYFDWSTYQGCVIEWKI